MQRRGFRPGIRSSLALLLLIPLLAQHGTAWRLFGRTRQQGGSSGAPPRRRLFLETFYTAVSQTACPTELALLRRGRSPRQSRKGTLLREEPNTSATSLAGNAASGVYCSSPAPDIHVLYTADPDEYTAMLASLHSALANSGDPGRLRFHLTIPDWADARELCLRLLQGLQRRAPAFICPASSVRPYVPAAVTVPQCLDSAPGLTEGAVQVADSCNCGSPQFHIIKFNAAKYEMPSEVAMGGHKNDRQSLLAPINFARNYADSYLLPLGVAKLVYLDADTIVQGDLVSLWETPLGTGHVAGVARSCKIHMRQLYDFSKPLVKATMGPEQCYINAGVYVVDLERYKELGIQRRIGALIQQHAQDRLWLQGVQQPSFVLAIANHSATVDPRWNQDSLGYNPKKRRLPACTLRSAYVLHWNGVYKPWKCPPGADCYKADWEPYRLDAAVAEGQ